MGEFVACPQAKHQPGEYVGAVGLTVCCDRNGLELMDQVRLELCGFP